MARAFPVLISIALLPHAVWGQTARAEGAETPDGIVHDVIPLDHVDSDKCRWRGWSWNRQEKATVQLVSEGECGRANAIRVETPTTSSFIRRKWNYAGDWEAITLWARSLSGRRRLMPELVTNQGPFRTSLAIDGTWQQFTLPREAFRPRRVAKGAQMPVRGVTAVYMFSSKEGTFDLSDVRLSVKPSLGIREVFTDALGNIFEPGSAPVVKVRMFNAFESDKQVTFGYVLRNYYGVKVKETMSPRKFSPKTYVTEDVKLPALDAGYYTCELMLREGDRQAASAALGLVVTPPPVRDVVRPFMGFSWHCLTETNRRIASRIGMHYADVGIRWTAFEPTKGAREQAAWDRLARLLALNKDLHLRSVGDICCSPPRYFFPSWAVDRPRPKCVTYKEFDAFGRFVEEVVTKHKDDIKTWAFVCEIDQIRNHDPEFYASRYLPDYIRLTKTGYDAVKKIDRDTVVVSCGISGVDAHRNFPVAEEFWRKSGGIFDSMDLHPYPRGWKIETADRPEDYIDRLFGQVEDIIGPGKTFCIEEMGYTTNVDLPLTNPVFTEYGRCVAAMMLIAFAHPQLHFLNYYHTGAKQVQGGHMFGILRMSGDHVNPYSPVATLATASRFLADAEAVEKLPLHKALYGYVYKKRQGAMATLWTSSKQNIQARIPGLSRFAAYDTVGAELPATDTFLISRHPTYFVSQEMDVGRVKQMFAEAKYQISPLKIAATISDTAKVGLTLVNQTEEIVKGKLSLSSDDLEIADAQKKYLVFQEQETALDFSAAMKGAMSGWRDVELTIDYRDDIAEQSYSTTKSVSLFPVTKLTVEPVVDGDLSEYQSLPAIVLDRPSDIRPEFGEVLRFWNGPDHFSVTAWLAWDEANLYFAAAVKDAVHCQHYAGSSIWRHDGFQIAFDMSSDARVKAIKGKKGWDLENDYLLGLALGPDGPVAFDWVNGSRQARRRLKDARVAIVRDEAHKTTYYEWAHPWADLAPFAPKKGAAFGFNFVAINANQKGDKAPYWMGITDGIISGVDPALFKSFVLR